MSYKDYAMMEFRAAGWCDENGKFKDEMQQAICEHVLKLLEVFSEEGHTNNSAPYAVKLFEKLALFKPIAPLTGEDWEWNDVSSWGTDIKFQNKRCSHVFKEADGRAYDSEGLVFYSLFTDKNGAEYKSYFLNGKSNTEITFSYMPERKYVPAESVVDPSDTVNPNA